MKMRTIFLSAILALFATSLQAQLGKVHGKALEATSPLPNYNVQLLSGDAIIQRSMTDIDGKYEFALLQPGDYSLQLTEGGLFYRYPFTIGPGETRPLNLELGQGIVYNEAGERVYKIDGGTIIERKPNTTPIMVLDPIQPIVISGETIRESAGPRGLETAIAMMPKVTQRDHGDALNMAGSRDNATAIYIDNVKVRGEFVVPQASISQIAVLSSGIPAEYGDVSGGVVIITTHNPGMKPFPGKPSHRKTLKQQKRGSNGSNTAPKTLSV